MFITNFRYTLFTKALLLSQRTFFGLQDVLKTCSRHVFKTSSKRLQRNNFSSSKTSWRRLEDVWARRLCWSWSRRLLKMYEVGEYIRLDQDVLKTSSEDKDERHLQDIFKTSSSRRMFAGNILIIPWAFPFKLSLHKVLRILC